MKEIEILSPTADKTVLAQSVRALVTVKWTSWRKRDVSFVASLLFIFVSQCLAMIID